MVNLLTYQKLPKIRVVELALIKNFYILNMHQTVTTSRKDLTLMARKVLMLLLAGTNLFFAITLFYYCITIFGESEKDRAIFQAASDA